MGIAIHWIKGGTIGVVTSRIVHVGGCSWPWRERRVGGEDALF